jgi:hypothetical protein
LTSLAFAGLFSEKYSTWGIKSHTPLPSHPTQSLKTFLIQLPEKGFPKRKVHSRPVISATWCKKHSEGEGEGVENRKEKNLFNQTDKAIAFVSSLRKCTC